MLIGIIYGLVYIGAAYVWGDWRRWREFYPTFLFFLLGDMLYHYMFVDVYPMWKFTPYPWDDRFGTTSMHISFSIMLIKYPATILIFLGRLPAEWNKRLGRVLLWSVIYSINEAITHYLGGIAYDHDWTFLWSILFNFVMFTTLLVHYLRPLYAWLISLVFIIFLWQMFDVPYTTIFR